MTPPGKIRKDYLKDNQRTLAKALEEVREDLERHADRKGGKPRPVPTGKPTEAAAMAREGDGESQLDKLCAKFGLTAFERRALILSAGCELDSAFAALCARAQGNPAMAYPTFGLALAALPDPHWSAVLPVSALRHWRLVELGGE